MSCERDWFHLGSVGVEILLTLTDCANDIGLVDLTDATLIQFTFRRNAATAFTRTAAVRGDPTNGQAYYVTVDGDFEVHGPWQVQATVTMNDGRVVKTSIENIIVKPSL